MTYRIITLGCKVNQQESEVLADRFNALGFAPAGKGEAAGVVVINSCTVTAVADSKTRQRIRQARAADPEALVCVIGCWPETSRDAALAMPEVDIAVGSIEKERTAEIVIEALKGIGCISSEFGAARPVRPEILQPLNASYEEVRSLPNYSSKSFPQARTRAMIKVEDGCDRFCAYCIIPYARGAVRSRPEDDVLGEAARLLEAGYKELVLTGVNLALYGRERDRASRSCGLLSLAERVCGLDAGGEFRVRLGSLEPTAIGPEEAARIAGIKGICPQFHLSLQSGAARTLKEMGRPYTPDGYAEIIRVLRDIDPLFSITTDVIAGFPGESDADFEESLEFVKRMGFARVHVFKYSKRPGTRAAEMAGQAPEEVKNIRSRRLIEAAEEGAALFLELNKGQKRRTLIYGPDKSGRRIRGLTDNGIDVLLPAGGGDYAPNTFADIVV